MDCKWMALCAHMGIEGFYVAVRGSIEDLSEPKVFFTQKAEKFAKDILNVEPHHLGLKLESFIVSGLNQHAAPRQRPLNKLISDCRTMIQEELDSISLENNIKSSIKMNYTNYERNIVERRNFVLVGWPLGGPVRNPSKGWYIQGSKKERSKIMKFEVYFVVIVCNDEHKGLVVVGNKEEAWESSAVTLQQNFSKLHSSRVRVRLRTTLSAAEIAEVLQHRISPLEPQEASLICGWYRTGDVGIIENGIMRLSGRIKDTVIVHGVSYGIPELETHLQTVEGVTHSFLGAALYRAPGQETEGFIIFYSPTFDLDGVDASSKLFATHRALRDICLKMITLPPQFVVPIPVNQMEKTTLGKLSRARLISLFKQGQLAKHIARSEELLSEARGATFVAPSTETEKALSKIYAGIFNLAESEMLKREGEAHFDLPEIPTIQVLKHPVISSLANYVDSLLSKDSQTEEHDPIVPLQLTGNKTPIFFVHPGVGEVLIFVNLAKYFQNERPFYALRARGFEPGHPFFTSMDEMVSCYAAAVKRTQAIEPYAIAGYSYGGVVAFEVAKRLEAMDEEVKFVGLINIPPHIADRMHEIDWTGGMLNLSYFLGLVSKHDANDLAPALRPMTRKEQREVVWKLSPPDRLVKLQLTPEKLDPWVAIAGSLIECGKDYNPSDSVSATDVFYAIPLRGSKSDWLNNQLKPWSGFSRGEPS
ncbi:Alpha/Beta hydrolase protein [Suillus discolor]|uniref:Alpha/Beta hydrolase protein n=1 Tax=Suillus discolor TaxID=1912936 RepID=A0A9P7FEA6_9AGAM|nr:Alpha/Beta hydrolase protein [Suillus discolor]KAG2113392.1 Alpha/Beta hydrolase protein [Suillus discolor]